MPADYVIDSARGAVFSRGWGRLTNDDLLAAQDALRADPAFHPGFRQLYDLTDVTDIAVTREAFPTFRARAPFDHTARQAFVVGSQAAFGMVRMYELLHDLAEDQFRVFRDLHEARDWLGIAGD
jgi:hypothetical protein